jgi:hypothetical protein
MPFPYGRQDIYVKGIENRKRQMGKTNVGVVRTVLREGVSQALPIIVDCFQKPKGSVLTLLVFVLVAGV